MELLQIFVIIFFLPNIFALDPYTKFTQFNLPPGTTGPESVALDRFQQGPYAGCISDGRILKYEGPDYGFVDFSFTAPNRTKELCDGETDPNLGQTCGRPTAFSFNLLTGILYIADANLGLFQVGPNGGRATPVINSACGVPFHFLNGADVDQLSGNVFLTDASLIFDTRNISQPGYITDHTGRLIKYNPTTKEAIVLLEGLYTPVGPAVSWDRSFVLFSEFGAKRITRYWLTGPKASTSEVFMNLTGYPLKVKRASTIGEYWVPVNQIVQQPRFTTPFAYKINSEGEVLLQKDLEQQYYNVTVNLVQEYNGNVLFIGTRGENYVGKYSIF